MIWMKVIIAINARIVYFTI